MKLDVDALLDTHPAWVQRRWDRTRAGVAADPARRRRWLTAMVVVWQLGEFVLPRRQLASVRLLLLTMIVFDSVATYVWVTIGLATEGNPLVARVMVLYGDGPGLALRALWSAALVIALTWLAERRSSVRPALLLVLVPLGAVTILHVTALASTWSVLLGS
ncbi:MAG: hypothetical protein EA340_02330 [Nitriliruptor sp.]|nr:MAG: hypothetical protein EA340_02330 [Nitriliruptor sp.]TVR22743.1 MAG: hypothetical protein EA387_08060 [Nitriliruptor sp.]